MVQMHKNRFKNDALEDWKNGWEMGVLLEKCVGERFGTWARIFGDLLTTSGILLLGWRKDHILPKNLEERPYSSEYWENFGDSPAMFLIMENFWKTDWKNTPHLPAKFRNPGPCAGKPT